jgi:hypothetical protein
LSQDQKTPAQIGRDHFIESFDVAAGNGKHRHNPRRMDDHVDLSKSFKRLFEQMLDVRGLRHIRLHRDGVSAGVFNLGYD